MDQGFIRVRVGEPKVSYDESGLRVEVEVEEGPGYNVGTVDIAGGMA